MVVISMWPDAFRCFISYGMPLTPEVNYTKKLVETQVFDVSRTLVVLLCFYVSLFPLVSCPCVSWNSQQSQNAKLLGGGDIWVSFFYMNLLITAPWRVSK